MAEQRRTKLFMALKIILFIMILSCMVAALLATLLPGTSSSSQSAASVEHDFKLICQTKASSFNIPVFEFKSLLTGLRVVIAQVEGPTVQGFFTIATEAHDDDGLPHTLEHLVFLGSEDYPYKGVLDLLANRCLAEGTNAWTGTDHTAYTVETAGKDGFLNFLPIYLEHLLYPTLTDSAFTTEVYHIDGQGDDAGVVYSEMQARENTGSERTFNLLARLLYPEPSGYRYETGGIMANLRNNTTNEKVRKYHKLMYRPENLHLIITGLIEPEDVFRAMESIEQKIVAKGDQGPFERPWQSPIPEFSKSEDVEVLYPSENEDTGIVRVGWRGPSIVHNITEFQSMEVLVKYLTEVSVSPLPKAFIEVEDPLASYIYAYMLEYATSSVVVTFGGVPVNKIDSIKPLLKATLKDMVKNESLFDAEVMRYTLKNLILKEESKLETSPHNTLSDYIILNSLYGKNCEDLNNVINKKVWLEHLLKMSTSYWLHLIEKYLVSAPSAVVRGMPSITEAYKLQEEEMNRVQKRFIELGEEGLKILEREVMEAERINEIPPPNSMLESVPVPSTANISFHSHKPYTNIQNHSSGWIPKSDPDLLDLSVVPVKMQLNDVNSNFVQVLGIMDTHSLTPTERMYIPLLMELLLESPIVKNGTMESYHDVITDLYEDTVKAENINGLYIRSSNFVFGPYFQNILIHLKMEMAKYAKGIEWLSDILFRVVLKTERITVKAHKLLNSIDERKSDGNTMLTLMYNDLVFKPDTNINRVNLLRQERFLSDVLATLKTNPSKILQDLDKVYKTVTNLDNLTVLLATKLQKLASMTNTTVPWLSFAPNGLKTSKLEWDIVVDWEERVPLSEKRNVTGYIAGVTSLESAFLLQSTPAITNYSHAELPALLTAISYFTQLEGPMWREIRGKGLSYSYSVSMKAHSGMFSLRLLKAVQLIDAYKEAVRIFNSYLNGSKTWNRLLFESARSSLIYEIIERESEVSDVVQQALYAYYRKVPHDYNKSFLRALDEVTLEDVTRVFKKYFRSLINPNSSITVIVCPESEASETQIELNKMGHSMEVVDTLEDSRFSRY